MVVLDSMIHRSYMKVSTKWRGTSTPGSIFADLLGTNGRNPQNDIKQFGLAAGNSNVLKPIQWNINICLMIRGDRT